MKTHPYTQLIVAFCVGALASCASSPAPTRMAVSASTRSNSPASKHLFENVNSYRRSSGAQKLQRHAGLDRLAQEHCEYLRQNRGTFSLHGKYVSHIGFQQRAFAARERYQMERISENVAASNQSSNNKTRAIMTLWKNSKEHHKNMLDEWTHTGVGVVVDSDGMIFATQLFSTINHSPMTTRERFNRF